MDHYDRASDDELRLEIRRLRRLLAEQDEDQAPGLSRRDALTAWVAPVLLSLPLAGSTVARVLPIPTGTQPPPTTRVSPTSVEPTWPPYPTEVVPTTFAPTSVVPTTFAPTRSGPPDDD